MELGYDPSQAMPAEALIQCSFNLIKQIKLGIKILRPDERQPQWTSRLGLVMGAITTHS